MTPEKRRNFSEKKTSLIELHADLHVLLFEMEHDKNINASQWQIASIRKSITDIGQKINTTKGVRRHG